MKKGLKERLDDLDNAVNEKKITNQQLKYEKEKKNNALVKKLIKGSAIAFACLFIFALAMSFLEDEPTQSEPVVISSTEENTSTPADEDKKEEPKETSKKNDIGSEDNPITVENCPEFAEILACKNSYDISYEKFAEEHYGQYVEFIANIQDLHSNYEYGKYWGRILLCGGEFPGSNTSPTGPYFRDEDAKEDAFDDAHIGPHENVHPYGTTVKVKAILRLYDKDAELYEIDLLYLTDVKNNPEIK